MFPPMYRAIISQKLTKETLRTLQHFKTFVFLLRSQILYHKKIQNVSKLLITECVYRKVTGENVQKSYI